MTDNRPKPHGGWYVVVAIQVTGNPNADRCPVPPTRAIGPVSWTRARALSSAWEREFGTNTATLTEKVPRQATLVRAV